MAELPPGIHVITSFTRDQWYKAFTFILTFMLYASFHLSRKPISIVKGELHKHCSTSQSAEYVHIHSLKRLFNESRCGWEPFDKNNYKQLLGALDYSFLCAYAVGMYLSGIIGERLPIRYYLTGGMFASGLFTAMFGFGYFYNIHSLSFYIIAQIANGLAQTTGWPSVVTCIGNWFGKGRRGLIMGLWNSHTSVGNILGSLIAGYWVSTCWGLSFVVPGIIIFIMGIVCFLFLIEHPKDVNCTSTSAHVSKKVGRHISLYFFFSCFKKLIYKLDKQGSGAKGGKINSSNLSSFSTDCPALRKVCKHSKGTLTFSINNSYKNVFQNSKSYMNGSHRIQISKLSTKKANKLQDPEMQCLLPVKEICTKQLSINNGVCDGSENRKSAISFSGALRIPGVVEFSLCLLFAKLVSYTFLFWLPLYITNVEHLDAKKAGDLSTLFDVGGIFGGILAGIISDRLKKRASTCGIMLLIAAPTLYIFSAISKMGFEATVVMLLICGALVNGPYALITTAVSADLGTHKSLQGNARALSTVTAIIDGTGSVGAALGPLLAGLLSPSGWNNVFYMLIVADACALLFLLRLIRKELQCRMDQTLFKEH